MTKQKSSLPLRSIKKEDPGAISLGKDIFGKGGAFVPLLKDLLKVALQINSVGTNWRAY